MGKSLPPLTWFRSFEAAARTLSFTAAAEEIGLTQSAVSQQVRSLELRLGVPLFVRRPRGLSLTDDGRRLLPQVGAALDTLASAAGAFDTGTSANLLTVATSVSVAQWLITPHLPSFASRYPDIRIRLLSAVWPDDFHTSRADVEIRFGSEKQVGEGAEALAPDRLVPMKAPRLHGRLEDLPLIETVGTSGGWKAWQAEVCAAPQPTLYTDTYGMALQLAAHGNGVALVSALLTGHARRSGVLELAYPGSIASQEGYFLSVNESIPAAVAFRSWLLELLSG
ncbi:LysR family transcriptional regulator [Tateyamaria sp. syn59]|uniref:LysR family transcriptional regulator n=1 Tax=Tateyamaria sp. syn59 TaxID=2576942 RepID=UPI0011BFE43B|nr:LysR family transcriptional regulator [Tateyamaria sp. syn59]